MNSQVGKLQEERIGIRMRTENNWQLQNPPDGEEPGALEVAQYAIGLLQLLLFVDHGVLQIVAIVATPAVVDVTWKKKP